MNSKQRSCAILIITLCVFGFSPIETAQAMPKFKLKGRWKLIKRRRNIRVYQMKVPGSKLIAVRGDAVFNYPITKVMHLLNDVPSKVKWVNRMVVSKIIERKSPTNYVTYTRFKFPWPVASRDFVIETKLVVYPKKKKIIRYQYSVVHPKAPKQQKGIVRAQLHYSRYIIRSMAGGKKTRMRAEGYGDPKGSIPSFIVNFIQRSWPMRSMKGIKKQLDTGKIPEDQYIKKALKQ